MKSSVCALRERGYIENIDINDYLHLMYEELRVLIHSQKAYERSIAVRLLGNHMVSKTEVRDVLLKLLMEEKGLYTKIEICNVLEMHGNQVAENMTALLGKIGNNQYDALPQRVSKKASYPLPRDIIARTLGKMKIEVLPILLDFLANGDIHAIREAIDAIGYMCFYNSISNEKLVVEKLMECFEIHKNDEVIRWKIIMAFSSFNEKDAVYWLEDVKKNDKEALVREEAKRSLYLVRRRN